MEGDHSCVKILLSRRKLHYSEFIFYRICTQYLKIFLFVREIIFSENIICIQNIYDILWKHFFFNIERTYDNVLLHTYMVENYFEN